MSVFSYYELSQKLIRPQLGTCPSGDIYQEHLLTKSKKFIAQANKTEGKLKKHLKKFLGAEISEVKEIEEIKGIIRTYSEILGERIELPDTLEELLNLSKELKVKIEDSISAMDELKTTVFMRDEDGMPCISGHLILGNIKEICRVIVNSYSKEEKKTGLFKSKVQLSEAAALDLKVVSPFVTASNDIVRNEDGTAKLNVRPIRFTDKFGETKSAIVASEELPVGTIFTSVLRIRKGSSLDNLANLKSIFTLGKNLGLGAWRGSGNMGSYVFKLKPLKSFKEDWGDWE